MTCRLPLCLVVSGLAMMVVAGPRLQARSEAAAVQEDPQSVVVRLRAELSRPSATWENYLDLAAALERADLQAEATRTLEQGIRRFPDNLTLWSRLGLARKLMQTLPHTAQGSVQTLTAFALLDVIAERAGIQPAVFPTHAHSASTDTSDVSKRAQLAGHSEGTEHKEIGAQAQRAA